MDFRAVMFDLDGTLLDTIEDLTESMNVGLAELGFPPRTVEECKLFVGDGTHAFARRSLPDDLRDATTVEALVAAMQAEYARRWDRRTRPYPGVAELLTALNERGLPAAVLSNKPEEFTRLTVGRLLGEWEFAVVRGSRDGVPRKPDPAAALDIAGEMSVAPAAFCYVGDTNTDMRTAVAAGMHAVGATWGFRTREELREHGAAALIDRPQELLELL